VKIIPERHGQTDRHYGPKNYPVFTARCYAQRSYSTRFLLVSLSVTMRYDYHIGWNTSKNNFTADLCRVFADSWHQITSLLQMEHLEILAGIGVGYGKWLLSYHTENIS